MDEVDKTETSKPVEDSTKNESVEEPEKGEAVEEPKKDEVVAEAEVKKDEAVEEPEKGEAVEEPKKDEAGGDKRKREEEDESPRVNATCFASYDKPVSSKWMKGYLNGRYQKDGSEWVSFFLNQDKYDRETMTEYPRSIRLITKDATTIAALDENVQEWVCLKLGSIKHDPKDERTPYKSFLNKKEGETITSGLEPPAKK